MIEQEITRLVNQSEKKGRFTIQELDDEINILDKSQVLPNTVEKYFSKKTKHSSICNNNKIIHLLHNQSENPNINQNFSTFIFEDNTKNWIDFDIVWRKFSQFHCDVSENNMEKIFNYTDLKSDEENNSSYFNDSLHINNNAEYDPNAKLLLFNNEINIGENAKKPVNPSNDNLTNVQTTHDISHSNIADIGMLSNITSTQFKNMHNEINFNFNANQNSNNYSNNTNSNYLNSLCNNKNVNTNTITSVNGNSASCSGDTINNTNLLNKTTKIEANCFNELESKTVASELNEDLVKRKDNQEIIEKVKYEKIENQAEKSNLNFIDDNFNKQDSSKIKLLNASNKKPAEISNLNIDVCNKNNILEANNTNINSNNLNCNTLIFEEILGSEANKNYQELKIDACDKKQLEEATEELSNNKSGIKNHNLNSSDYIQKIEKQNSPLKIKNLEINFCEKRIINSPAFSPINSDYSHKFDKLNLDLNSLVNNTNKNASKEKFKLKSNDRLNFLEDYFKEEKDKNSNRRQKRIFSEFKTNRNFEKNYFYNLKITNENNFCFIPQNKKIVNNKNIRKKKTAKNKKNINLQISENIEVEISAGNNLDENSNDDKENYWDINEEVNLSEKQNKFSCENFISKGNKNNQEYICCSCGNKNFIVD